jgi:hypothetical protein
VECVRSGNDDCIRLRTVEHFFETAVRVVNLKIGGYSASPVEGDVGNPDKLSIGDPMANIFGVPQPHLPYAENSDS